LNGFGGNSDKEFLERARYGPEPTKRKSVRLSFLHHGKIREKGSVKRWKLDYKKNGGKKKKKKKKPSR